MVVAIVARGRSAEIQRVGVCKPGLGIQGLL